MPLIIEQLAFEHGTLEGTQGTPCNQWTSDTKPPACLVPFIGSLTTDTVSYTFYVTAISVLCQAIVFISIGSLADHGNSRKTLLIGFTAAGSLFNVLIMTAYRPGSPSGAASLPHIQHPPPPTHVSLPSAIHPIPLPCIDKEPLNHLLMLLIR